MRADKMGRPLRSRFYYSVPEAGAKVGWKRTDSYRAVWRGLMPTVWCGQLLLVPKEKWDRQVKRLGGPVRPPPRKPKPPKRGRHFEQPEAI
jgi:hypothetical protein